MNGKLTLEERVTQLEDEIARMKRDNSDTLQNLDSSNFGVGLSQKFNSVQQKANTLADVISVNGTTVTIRAHRIEFENVKQGSSEPRLLGYCEYNSMTRWHLPNVTNNGNYD